MLNKTLAISILLLFILIGCGEKKDEPIQLDESVFQIDSTDLQLEKVEDEQGPISLEYKFKKGDKFRYRFSSISVNEQNIQSDTTINTNLKQTISYLIDMEISEVDEDGIANVAFNIRSIKLDADANGEKFNIVTDNNSDSTKMEQFAEHFSLTNSPFSVRVDRKGDLIEFSRIDRMVNKFLQIRGLTDSVTTEEKGMLRSNFTQSAVKPLVLQIFRVLPESQVAMDSSWSIKQQPISMTVYQVNYENVFRISAFEKLGNDKIAVLDATVKSSVVGEDKAAEGGVTYTFTKPKTSAEGKIYFNVDKGMIQRSKTTTNVQFSMTMEAMSPQGLQKGTRTDKNINTNILELL